MNANYIRSINAGSAILSSSLEYAFVPDMSIEDEREYDSVQTLGQQLGHLASDMSWARKQKEYPQSFVGEYAFLSNMYITPVIIGEMVFPSAENAFQAMKCKTRKQMEQFQTCTPQEAKRIGKEIDCRSNWDQLRIPVMRKILEAKFEDDDLAVKLLKTEDQQLCEKNYWNDSFWGKCWVERDLFLIAGEEVSQREWLARQEEPGHSFTKKHERKFTGENHLGKLLCEVREKIRKTGHYEQYLKLYAEQANIDIAWLGDEA